MPADQQKKAVAFLIEHGFRTPPSLIAPDILDRLESHGTAERILSAQQSLLRSLINKIRLDRMSELAARAPKEAYTPADLVKDLHAGILSELKAKPIEIDLYRRNLQRAYVDLLAGFLDNPTEDSDLPALARAELEGLSKEIKGLLDRVENRKASPVVRRHLEDIKTRADHALDPIPSAPAPQRSPFGLPVRRGGDEVPEPR